MYSRYYTNQKQYQVTPHVMIILFYYMYTKFSASSSHQHKNKGLSLFGKLDLDFEA